MRALLGALTVLIIPKIMALDLGFPTENDALLRGDGPAFYQYVERDYQGDKSTPWEGGQYGFVRDPLQTPAGIVYTRFHEGIDIKPLQRDAQNEPLDEVRAIADGQVVHTNRVAGYSNYGRYVVIEHTWDGSKYYSLYGHLNTIAVKPGQQVKKGESIAVMGYTGVGINRERAHLHLELNLLLSHRFEAWHDATFKNDPNHNGIYNGLNLTGINIARLYLALQKNPNLTVPEFLASEETFYKVTLPKSGHFELPKLYPWMVQGSADAKPRSWEISFTRSGVPLKIEPSDKKVKLPELTYVKKGPVDYSHLTRGDLTGHGDNARLSPSGLRTMQLLIYPD
jgi:murein DD-endopeptidase MepM/ murein hydrolase activator NlpD